MNANDGAGAGGVLRSRKPDVLRVLLIEDDPGLSDALADALGSLYGVTAVADGASALRTLDGDRFDVIVLDLMLPRLTGEDFLAEQVRRGDPTPCVVMSADHGRLRLLTGAFATLSKPFLLADLVELIQRAAPTTATAGG